MKLAIDAHVLADKVGAGKARYTREIVAALARKIKVGEGMIFTDAHVVVPSVYKKFIIPSGALARARAIKKTLERYPHTVFIEPTSFLPAIFSPNKTILVVHDLAVFVDPNSKPSLRTQVSEKLLLHRAVARATKIVAVSPTTARDLHRIVPAAARKITIIGEGVSQLFLHRPAADLIRRCRAHYHLPEKYLLFVGTIEPRKNVAGLIKAYALLPEKLKNDYPLVLAGRLGWHAGSQLSSAKQLESAGQLRRLDFVSDRFLPALYVGASAFVYPSFSEGFGLPVLEALAFSVPVITSRNSACADLVGVAGLTVDPYRSQQLTAALARILTDQKLAQKLVTLGRARAREYRWSKTANALLKLVNQLRSDV